MESEILAAPRETVTITARECGNHVPDRAAARFEPGPTRDVGRVSAGPRQNSGFNATITGNI